VRGLRISDLLKPLLGARFKNPKINALKVVKMSPELEAGLIGLAEILIGALPAYAFMRKKSLTEIDNSR
jgi:hypothetical protein